MLYITIKQNFIHIGIACLVAILIVYKRYGFAFIVAAGATVGLTDASSHYILKEGIGRLRPCHVLPDLINTVNCSNSFSFPSNHAGNTFAAATLISLCFRNTTLLVNANKVLVVSHRELRIHLAHRFRQLTKIGSRLPAKHRVRWHYSIGCQH